MPFPPPMIFGTDTPRVGLNDPISAHEAADATAHLVAPSHRLVERILEDHGKPMTPLEVEQAAVYKYGWDKSTNRIRSALPELEHERTVRYGFVRRAGDTRRRQLWGLKEWA
jgi:hypothetical protein